MLSWLTCFKIEQLRYPLRKTLCPKKKGCSITARTLPNWKCTQASFGAKHLTCGGCKDPAAEAKPPWSFYVFWNGDRSKPCTPVVHIKITGKWIFIFLKMVFISISRYWSIAKSMTMTCQAFFRSERASSNLSKLMRTQAFWKYLWLAPCRAPCSNLFGHARSNSWRFRWPEGWALNVCGWELHSEAKWKFSIWLYLACILLIATHAPAYVQKTLRPSPICFTKKSNETWTIRPHRPFLHLTHTHCGVMASKKCEGCHSLRLISWVAWQ